MKKIYLDYIVEGTGGRLYARADNARFDGVSSVEIDNRRIKEECLFFCIIGARIDAHSLLEDVRERGCHNIVVSDESWAERMAGFGDMNIVLVEDTIVALDNLAERYMDDWKGLKRVAISGSAGKTTTKEFLYSILSTRFKTGKNIGNYNSETGIPLTVFNSYEDDIEMAITEIGIGDGRDMRYLVSMVKPDNAILTNVGSVHMEFFESSREKLLEAKLRITELFNDESTLVVNNCCDNLSVESIRAHSRGDFRIITVGDAEDCDYRIADVRDRGIDGVCCTLIHRAVSYEMQLPIVGAHNLYNAAEAIAIGELYGISVEASLAAIKSIDIVANRLDVVRGRYTILNDTYNANPEAMKAAIEVIRHTAAARRGLIVGDMLELGRDEISLHREVGEYIAEGGIDFVITLGRLGAEIANAVSELNPDIELHSFDDIDSLMAALEGILKDGDLFLVKASNSLGVNRIVKGLETK